LLEYPDMLALPPPVRMVPGAPPGSRRAMLDLLCRHLWMVRLRAAALPL